MNDNKKKIPSTKEPDVVSNEKSPPNYNMRQIDNDSINVRKIINSSNIIISDNAYKVKDYVFNYLNYTGEALLSSEYIWKMKASLSKSSLVSTSLIAIINFVKTFIVPKIVLIIKFVFINIMGPIYKIVILIVEKLLEALTSISSECYRILISPLLINYLYPCYEKYLSTIVNLFIDKFIIFYKLYMERFVEEYVLLIWFEVIGFYHTVTYYTLTYYDSEDLDIRLTIFFNFICTKLVEIIDLSILYIQQIPFIIQLFGDNSILIAQVSNLVYILIFNLFSLI